MELEKSRNDKKAVLLVLLCALVYAVSYLGRKSYDSNINEIMAYFTVGKGDAGLVGTFFFIAYAIGQVFHGLMCKKYNPRIAVVIAICVACIVNLLVGILPSNGFYMVKYLWFINGFAQATLWPCIILICNKYLKEGRRKFAIFVLSFPVSVGTFLSYGLSALFSFLENFHLTFYLSSIALFLVGMLWLLTSKGLIKRCLEDNPNFNLSEESQKEKNSGKWGKSFISLFIVMAVLAVINNFVKDGVTTWTPTVLTEKYGLENWVSVLLTVLLPLFAIIGANLTLLTHRKIGNFITLSGLLYLIATLATAVLVICLGFSAVTITLTCFIVLTAVMYGINNVITSIFPMLSKSNVNAGMVAGLMDGFCYLGSALSSFGLGYIAQSFNWNVVFYIFFSACAFALILCFIYKLIEN